MKSSFEWLAGFPLHHSSKHDWVDITAFCIALLYVCVVCVCVCVCVCVVCVVCCVVCVCVCEHEFVRACMYALCACISSVYMHICLVQLGDTSTLTIGHTDIQHISNYCFAQAH